MIENIIIIAIVAVIVAAAGIYIYKARKSGKKCIGCPGGCNCSEKKCSCCHDEQEK